METKEILKKGVTRRKLCEQSHRIFFASYFSEYIKYPSADFHRKILDVSENEEYEFVVVTAFRGSGKSTIISTSLPIWSIVGKQKKKFIIIISRTKEQANLILKNIKSELEHNGLLKKDFGPFESTDDEWRSSSIVIPKYGARIMSISEGQSIRGLKHGSYRPDLVICDDIEDVQSTKTKEGRSKTYNWFNSAVIPIGDIGTRTIIIGNVVHRDCLTLKLKERIENSEIQNAVYMEFPLLDSEGYCLWKEKYPNEEDITKLRERISHDYIWAREYLLQIIPDAEQIVHKEWIQYHDGIPLQKNTYCRGVFAGVDLAISTNESADCTALVAAQVHGYHEQIKILIKPEIINDRIGFAEQIDAITLYSNIHMTSRRDTVFIENVGYQDALTQTLRTHRVNAVSVRPQGDKRMRLNMTTQAIRDGIILFPKHGCEELIEQLLGFGYEKHDDLVDAFSLLIIELLHKFYTKKRLVGIVAI